MPHDYAAAYESLSAAIREIQATERPPVEKTEACFLASLASWEGLKQAVKPLSFDNEAGEIHFFKLVKPRFTSLIEYFTQSYHALLFQPFGDLEAALEFWKIEARRIDRFFDRNAAFVQYYEHGQTDMDIVYFLRDYSDQSNLAMAPVYDLDPQTSTSHDWLVSKILGMGMYREDVGWEIRRLTDPGHPERPAPPQNHFQ